MLCGYRRQSHAGHPTLPTRAWPPRGNPTRRRGPPPGLHGQKRVMQGTHGGEGPPLRAAKRDADVRVGCYCQAGWRGRHHTTGPPTLTLPPAESDGERPSPSSAGRLIHDAGESGRHPILPHSAPPRNAGSASLKEGSRPEKLLSSVITCSPSTVSSRLILPPYQLPRAGSQSAGDRYCLFSCT